MAVGDLIGRNAPLAVSGTKSISSLSSQLPAHQAFALQEPYARRVLSSSDALEGARAFAEKRDPCWTGV
jgi:enoyl-CoA hydratase/carnithine racemase